MPQQRHIIISYMIRTTLLSIRYRYLVTPRSGMFNSMKQKCTTEHCIQFIPESPDRIFPDCVLIKRTTCKSVVAVPTQLQL